MPDPDTRPSSRRLGAIAFLFAIFIAGSALFNELLDRPDLGQWRWTYPATVPPAGVVTGPLGADLAVFIEGSDAMYHGENPYNAAYPYPPFISILFYPFVMMSPSGAYWVMYSLILACNVCALLLLTRMTARAFTEAAPDRGLELALASALVASGIGQFFGYPLEFALERGNYDSLVLLAVLAGIWVTVRFPGALWTQIAFFSLATHLKVYPALLLFLPIWRHGRYALPPILCLNLALLFCFGLERGRQFLAMLQEYAAHPNLWAPNHSAVSFSALVVQPALGGFLPSSATYLISLALLLAPPLAFWWYGSWRLFRRGYSERTALLALALATPVMCLLPSVSYDYKLVIMLVPAFLCVLHLTRAFLETGGARLLLGLAATLYCLLVLSRSVLESPLLFTANKYPAVLLMAVLTFWVVLRETRGQEPPRPEPGPARP